MMRFARALRALADRIDPPVAIAATVPVYLNGREIARAVARAANKQKALR